MRDKVKEMNRGINEARKNDEAYQKLVAELSPKQQELNKKMHELRMSYPGYPEALAAEQKLNRQSSELWKKAEAECRKDPKFMALEERIKEQRKKVNPAPQGSSERRELEDELNSKMHKAKRDMVKQRHETLPGVRENERQRHKARWVHREKLERAIRQMDAYKQLDAEIRRLQRQMRYRPDPKLVAQRDQLDREVGRISSGVRQVKEAAAAETNALEAQLLRKSRWSKDFAKASKKLLNGNTPHASDDIGQLESAKELQALPWRTTVDWDGRAPYEKDKKVIAQPVMQHYLKRMKPWMYE